jgi:hypothetical protein
MVGVVKQKKKATGEMIEYTISMGRSLKSEGLEESMKYQTKGMVQQFGGGAMLSRSRAAP